MVSNSTVNQTNSTLYPPITPDLALMYYRESTFALLQFIQNTSNASSVQTYDPNSGTSNSTVLPLIYADSMRNLTFQNCVNVTIGNTLPIVAPGSSGLSTGAIAGIVIGSIFGAFALIWGLLVGVAAWRSRRSDKMDSLNEKRLVD
jgi:hypothetical protein